MTCSTSGTTGRSSTSPSSRSAAEARGDGGSSGGLCCETHPGGRAPGGRKAARDRGAAVAAIGCRGVGLAAIPTARDPIQVYREALAKAGHDPSTREVGARVMTDTGRTPEEAHREFADPAIWYFRTFGKDVAPKLGQPPVEGYEWYTQIRDLASVVEWQTLLDHGAVCCGEADFVTERLAELERGTGIDHVLGWTSWTRLFELAEERITAPMERMRDPVMPALR